MSEEFQKQLKEEADFILNLQDKFPNMFTDQWVIINSHVPKGWQKIIYNLCDAIHAFSHNVKVLQIKEKFGTLRFYYDGGDERVRGMVILAEYLCSKTCQETGKDGDLYFKQGWYCTLNKKRAKKLGFTPLNK